MTDPLYDSRNPNHGRAGGLRDPEPRLSADIVDRLRDRDAIVVGGMFHAIPALKEAADEIERLRDRISAVEAKGVLAPAQGSFNQAKDYVDNAIASFAFDPPDNQFLKGYLAALEVIQAEAFTAQPPAAPVETLDALVEKITPENRHQEVGIECSSAGTEHVKELLEVLDVAEQDITDLNRISLSRYDRSTKTYQFDDAAFRSGAPGSFAVVERIRAVRRSLAPGGLPTEPQEAVKPVAYRWRWAPNDFWKYTDENGPGVPDLAQCVEALAVTRPHDGGAA
jgi:hypothetical protein